MEKILLVVVTRMRANCGKPEDEFVNDWRRHADEHDALLRGGTVDIVLIHGYEERFLKGWDALPPEKRGTVGDITGILDTWIGQALGRHALEEVDYPVRHLLYHEPASNHVVSGNLESFAPTSRARMYSSVTGGLLKAVGELQLDEAQMTEVKEQFPRLRITEFSVRKHRITNALAPLSLDLRTAAERSWNESLADEITKAYEEGGARRALEEARRQVYGPPGDDEPDLRPIRTIVDEATRGSPRTTLGVQSAWREVVDVFPSEAATPAHVFATITKLEVLEHLKSLDSDEVKGMRLWMNRLNDALESLRREMER